MVAQGFLAATPTCTLTALPPSEFDLTQRAEVRCGETYAGTTVGKSSRVDSYNCTDPSWVFSGPEMVHVLVVENTASIQAHLSNAPWALDVFILTAADPMACVAVGDFFAAYHNAPAGMYYLVVDGFDGEQGAYTLDVTCSDSGESVSVAPTNTVLPRVDRAKSREE